MSQVKNGRNDLPDDKKPSSADPMSNTDEDSSTKPKSKSYAEILKGFEEIEKIFKRDKGKS